MGKLIDKLWETEIEFVEFQTEEMKRLLEIANVTAKELESKLNEEQKVLFNDYCKYLGEYHDLMENKVFSRGFCFGAQIGIEVCEDSQKEK